MRESELLGPRWSDFDADAATVPVTGKLVRATGHGPARLDNPQSAAGKRTLPLPRFAVDALTARRQLRDQVGAAGLRRTAFARPSPP